MTRTSKNPFQTVQQDTEHLKAASSQLVEDVGTIGGAVQDLAEDSWELFKKTMKANYRHFQGRLKTRVKNKPLKSLMIAAGIGFLAGWLKR